MKKASLFLLLTVILLVLSAAALSEADPRYALPLDIDFPCYEPNPACYTDNGYHDDSLDVRCERRIQEGVIYDIIWIEVKHPSQLRTLTAGAPNELAIELASKMSRYVHAVAAINGEFYLQRDRDIYVWRQGVIFRNAPDPMKDVLIIDSAGDFHIYTSENKSEEIKSFIANGGDIVNAFSFGPGLVVDGKKQKIRDNYFFNVGDRLPRTVIGQTGPLSYVFVVAEGKKLESKGCSHQQMADFMDKLGVQQAYNLDGGQSTVIMFHGNYFYKDYSKDMEREQSDIVFVTTAVDPKTWKK